MEKINNFEIGDRVRFIYPFSGKPEDRYGAIIYKNTLKAKSADCLVLVKWDIDDEVSLCHFENLMLIGKEANRIRRPNIDPYDEEDWGYED